MKSSTSPPAKRAEIESALGRLLPRCVGSQARRDNRVPADAQLYRRPRPPHRPAWNRDVYKLNDQSSNQVRYVRPIRAIPSAETVALRAVYLRRYKPRPNKDVPPDD